MIRRTPGYEAFLKNDLLPRSNGDFRIGADNYRKKLLYDEMVDIPLDRLLEIGYANLRQNQQAFRETAKKIDPSENAASRFWTKRRRIIRPADKLLQTFRDTLGGLRDYIDAAPHRDHPVAGAADRRRDAAVHARADDGVHGYARRLMRRSRRKRFST